MQDLIDVNTVGIKQRLAIAAATILIALILGWVAITQQIGSLLAEMTTLGDPNAAQIASLSVNWAPNDPRTHNLLSAVSEGPDITLGQAEQAVQLAPHEYRWRVALGRAYEQADMLDKAEFQFKTAAALAPHYAYPRWHLGNFYLRQGREDLAIEELRRATRDHALFREQVFSLVWDLSGGDPVRIEMAADASPEAQVFLSRFLAQRGQGEHALRIWNKLGDSQKENFRGMGRYIVQDLYSKGSFPEALELARQLGDTDAVPESISNASFENTLPNISEARFNWEVAPGDQRVEISPDSQIKHSGVRSLRISFRGLARSDLSNVYQTVIVRPETAYSLSFRYRTEGLRSSVRPVLQIISARDNSVLGTSEMFAPDSSEWSLVTIPFRTDPNTNAVSIRTFRPTCGEQCSITGKLWYDDLELTRRQ